MQSVLSNAAGGLFCAACLLAGLPSAATDFPEDETETSLDPERAGDVIWKTQIGTSYADEAIGVATGVAGNVLIGRSFVDGRSVRHTAGVEYSPAGKRLRTRQLDYVGPFYFEPTMAWEPAGDFLVASSAEVDLYDWDYLVAKYSPAGKRLWTDQRGYGAHDVASDGAGNVLLAGQTVSPGECCDSKAFATKYSPAGDLLWTSTLDGWSHFGTSDVIANAVATDSAGDVFLAGYTFNKFDGGNVAFVAKYDADGNFLWTGTLDFGDVTSGNAVATDAAGNVFVVGTGGGFGKGQRDAFVAKYGAAGELLWTRHVGTPEDDWGYGVATDAAGNVVMGGTTRGSLGALNQGSDDAFVAKYTRAGKRLWARQFGTAGNDSTSGVATDASGNVVIEGTTTGSLGGRNRGDADVFVVKLRP